MEFGKTVYVTNREGFRSWLEKNGQNAEEIWLVIFKVASGVQTMMYEEAIDEAMCFGWIDDATKSIDTEKFAQRFIPRKPKSIWTEAHLERARKLLAGGRMTDAGMETLPDSLNHEGLH